MHPQPSSGLLNNATRGILIAVLFVSACGTQKDLPHGVRSVVGIVCVTGNEPFTELSLQSEAGGMIKIRNDTSRVYRELRKLQGQKLRVQFRPPESKSDTSSISVERYDLVNVQ